MIHIREGFVDRSRVEALLAFCRNLGSEGYGGEGHWAGRTVRLSAETEEVKAIADAIAGEIRQAIAEVCGQRLYPDCRNLVRWREGDWMGLHADGDYPGGEFSWRKYGAILYLNDDYQGGEIHFPNQGLVLKPAPGTLVFFPGHKPYEHGVREVTQGVRYNMATFWTDDPARCAVEALCD